MEGFPPGLVILVIATGLWITLRGDGKCVAILKAHLAAQGLELVDARKRWFLSRPFWLVSNVQRVFDIVVLDNGRRRTGTALVGGWLTGSFSDEVRVRWHDP